MNLHLTHASDSAPEFEIPATNLVDSSQLQETEANDSCVAVNLYNSSSDSKDNETILSDTIPIDGCINSQINNTNTQTSYTSLSIKDKIDILQQFSEFL